MITNLLNPELNNHDVQEPWFQQDGATCYTARATIELLKDTFGDRLISRFGPVNWPPRSCDLTPLDYFFFKAVFSASGSWSELLVNVFSVRALVPMKIRHVEGNKLGRSFQSNNVAAVALLSRCRTHGRRVMSSSPVPLKTRRVGERCTLSLSIAQTSSCLCGVVVR
ncbi:putative LOC100569746 [Trichonephila clavipes]|nr:putative LOC100569746 [Trichonephila clavipes]